MGPALRRHFALATREAIALIGLGSLADVYGVFGLLTHRHHHSPWFWLFLGTVLLLLGEIRIAHRAISQRDDARVSATTIRQKFIEVAEGATVQGLTALDNQMVAYAGETFDARAVGGGRKRWLRRGARLDLADRCNRCSTELLSWFHDQTRRPYRPWPQDEEARERADREDHEQREDVAREFAVRFAVQARDLLNECSEAGYQLPPDLDTYRRSGWTNQLTMEEVGQGLGVLALRLRRKARRL